MFTLYLAALPEEERHFVERLYDRYKGTIYSISYDILSNQRDAEDTVNEVMIKVINNVSKFIGKDDKDIICQLVVYTKNTAIDLYRKNIRRSNNETDFFFREDDCDITENELTDKNVDVEKEVINAITVEMIEKVMKNLSPNNLDVLKLRLYMDYSFDQIGAILNISAETARKRYERSKNQVRSLINKVSGEWQ